jgi:hypothetical protein
LINTECEMVEELKACLEANDIVNTATHQVATQEDLLALLDANLGVAIIPDGASATNGFRRIPLMRLELARTVSVYTVAGRPRAVACATLLNLLRAADWSFDARTAQQGRAH